MQAVYRFLKKYVDPWARLGSILPLASAFAVNSLIYFGTNYLTREWHHYDFTLDIDRAVPFVPEFVWIYVGCYIFWIVNYLMVGHFDKKHFYQFVTADYTSRLVCLVFFILLPTTNVRPEVLGDSAASSVMRWLYDVDLPSNLFPSIHCLVSWFCYIGIRGRKEIPKWYRAFSCFFALLVAASTQFTKQHYIVDVIGGIGLAELMFYLSRRFQYYEIIKKFFEKINSKLRGLLLKSSCDADNTSVT